MKQSVSILLLFTGAFMFLPSIAANTVCYPPLGCFSTDAPFTSLQRPISFLPESPEKIKTKFLLYTRESVTTPQSLDARFPETALSVWTNFKARPTKFIIHGFFHTVRTWPWMETAAQKLHLNLKDCFTGNNMARELLKYRDYNAVVVDWSGGNQFPYTQATANTRVVGAQIGVLINSLIANGTLTADDFHIIGHSLGAHIAGYAGERVPGLGRISGLDPAGPYFRDIDIRVRLDDTDAKFVDVMHTDATGNFEFGIGTTTEGGDVSFFPNGGHDQPGCVWSPIPNILESGLIKGVVDSVFCSHLRAVKYFHESINSPCPFLAFPCPSEEHFQNNLCETCGDEGCSRMGFHADTYKPRAGQSAKYYLRTSSEAPFCRYHYAVTVKLSSGPWRSTSGEASILISGNSIITSWVSLTGGKTTRFNPGESLTFYVEIPQDVGNVTAVSFKFQRSFSLFTLGESSNVGVEEISIYAQETGARFKFCDAGKSLDLGSYITLISAC